VSGSLGSLRAFGALGRVVLTLNLKTLYNPIQVSSLARKISITRKYKTRVEMVDTDKHTSLPGKVR
jgi:hypothetical protein